MTGTSAAVQATCRRSAYRPYRTAGRKAEYGRFSVLPCPEIYRNLRIKDSVKIDPACGSGGMFVQTGDFVNRAGMTANTAMTFFGQEKVEYNARLCLMNIAVHGLTGVIKSGEEANTFYHDAHNLVGCCDYVMANPPFNVDKVKAESCENAGRLPFGLPAVNKSKEVGNANYLWISYFYAYLKETGRAGFVMASSATDSQGNDKDIRQKLVESGHVDVMISVGNNFFYTKSLPCSLWFFDKGKPVELQDKVLFIDARNYYTVVDRTLNEWTEWQLKNLNAIVWLYRGEAEKYQELLKQYEAAAIAARQVAIMNAEALRDLLPDKQAEAVQSEIDQLQSYLFSRERFAYLIPLVEASQKALGEAESAALKANDSLEKSQKAELARAHGCKTYKGYEKRLEALVGVVVAMYENCKRVLTDAAWLYEKFGEGEYQDIPGLCRIAYTTKDAQGDDESEISIEEKGWSLTPGAYVGVAPQEDDGVDFKQRMREIHEELLTLQAQSNELMETISRNIKELGI